MVLTEELVVGLAAYAAAAFTALHVGDWCFVPKGVDSFGTPSTTARLARSSVYAPGATNMDLRGAWCR